MQKHLYQFNLLHLMTAFTLLSFQIGIVVHAVDRFTGHFLTKFIIVFIVMGSFVSLQLMTMRNQASLVGEQLAVVYQPIYYSRMAWQVLLLIIGTIVADWFDASTIGQTFAVVNLVYIIAHLICPTAIIGRNGAIHSISIFTPWRDIEISEDSRDSASTELLLVNKAGFPFAIPIPKQLPELSKICTCLDEQASHYSLTNENAQAPSGDRSESAEV